MSKKAKDRFDKKEEKPKFQVQADKSKGKGDKLPASNRPKEKSSYFVKNSGL